MRKLRVIGLMIALITNLLYAQKNNVQPYDKLIASKELKEDLALLKYNLEAIHAGLYEYTPKEKLDQAFIEIEKELTEPMTAMDFNRKLCTLHSLIGNGHTNFEFASSYIEATQSELPRFPFAVYMDNRELYITRNYAKNEAIQVRWKLKSINGEKAMALFDEFVSLKTRDGYNLSGPETYVGKSFSYHYALFRGTPEEFELVLEDEQGKERNYAIEALKLDTIRKYREERYGKPKPSSIFAQELPGLKLEIQDKIATINIYTFSEDYIKKHGEKSKKWFQDAFEKIVAAGVEHLIIDMRDNGGGGPATSVALMSHLLEEPFTFYKELSTITRKIPNPELYKSNVRLLNLIAPLRVKKQDNGTYAFKTLGSKPYQPAAPIYKGKIYVLVNGVSFSQTGETAAFLKSETDAIFIGEEVGGNAYQNTSGEMLQLELPNSKNIAQIPIVLWEMNVKFENTGHGVKPDHLVRASLDEFLEEKDVVMEFTLDLIGKM
ncbi:MAG: S41 family peptidase [Bacteroidota bacterium]